MSRRPCFTRLVVALIAGVVLATSACDVDDDPVNREDAAKQGTGEERHDLEPLTSRFAALRDVESATWFSGTLGSDRSPGPSTYWINAVITVSTAEMDRIVATYDLAVTDTEPDVEADLLPDLPPGELERDPDLDTVFSTSGFTSIVWVDVNARQLVVTARGDGS